MAATFTIKRGDTWSQSFEWRQGSETGDPVDLTGAQAWLHLRDKRDTLIADVSEYLTVNGPAGTVSVDVPREVTRAFPVGKLYFDIELSIDEPSTETMILNVVEDKTVLPL